MNISDSTSVLPSLEILAAGSAPQTDPASADRHAAAATGFPHAEALLDSTALSELLGREVVINRLKCATLALNTVKAAERKYHASLAQQADQADQSSTASTANTDEVIDF